jgi:hypothetical protein
MDMPLIQYTERPATRCRQVARSSPRCTAPQISLPVSRRAGLERPVAMLVEDDQGQAKEFRLPM